METIKVKLDWFPNTNHTGFYVALKNGYFEEVGLHVDILGDVQGELETEDADIVLGPQISMLGKMAEDVPITVIATVTQRNDSGIVSLKEAGIHSLKDLEHKRLTHWKAAWFHGLMEKAMDLDGGDYNKVQLIQMNVEDITSTLGSLADAVWVYENWENQELLEAGEDIHFIRLAEIDPLFDFCAPCLAATHTFLQERPETVRAFLACLNQGYKEAAMEPKESILSVREYMPYATDDLYVRSQKHLANILLDEYGNWGYIYSNRWNTMADWLIEKGLYDKRRDTEYTNEYLPG